MYRAVIGGLIVSLLMVGPAAAARISVGDIQLLPGQAAARVPIHVTAEIDPVTGYPETAGFVLLNLMIGDLLVIDDEPVLQGGPGPKIVDVDLISDTIFGSVPHLSPLTSLPWPQLWEDGIMTDHAGPIDPQNPPEYPEYEVTGLLATVLIDTTGVGPGTWDFVLDSTLSGITELRHSDTGASRLSLSVTNGTITVVPEPSTVVMLVSLLTCTAVLFRRRKEQ